MKWQEGFKKGIYKGGVIFEDLVMELPASVTSVFVRVLGSVTEISLLVFKDFCKILSSNFRLIKGIETAIGLGMKSLELIYAHWGLVQKILMLFFGSAFIPGEESSDEMTLKKGKIQFKSNHAGGILGGISSGQSIITRFVVKPTSSILKSKKTVTKKLKKTAVSVGGRHDPCVGIRAVPIGEAMLACVLADHFLRNKIFQK